MNSPTKRPAPSSLMALQPIDAAPFARPAPFLLVWGSLVFVWMASLLPWRLWSPVPDILMLVLAFWWLAPQPPKQVPLATGPAGSAYAEFGKRYAAALKPNGIEVILKPTDGSLDNLELLRKGEADVAFVRGGSASPVADEEAGLTSLGGMLYRRASLYFNADPGSYMLTLAASGKIVAQTAITLAAGEVRSFVVQSSGYAAVPSPANSTITSFLDNKY